MNVRIWGLSKTQANYRPAPRRDVRCARCEYMFPPLAVGGCRLVRRKPKWRDTRYSLARARFSKEASARAGRMRSVLG
jgi:hypothetical protein